MSFQLKSPVVLFKHSEYGTRLLFKQGVVNPRDKLGKNGVTIHNWFTSLFYRTIAIEAKLIDEQGKEKNQVFNVNRNSLIEYLGKDVSAAKSDEELIKILESKLWKGDSNSSADKQQLAQQIKAGSEGLRHAGRHNQRFMNGFYARTVDYLKGSFLGWLYQKTIGGLNRIKLRFLFVGNEESILEAGEILAKERFHDAYQTVPAYKTHIVTHNGQNVTNSAFRFSDVAITDKDKYIKPQQHDSATHRFGKYPERSKRDTSTGTKGKPTPWVRSEEEISTVKKSLKLAAKIQFGERRLSYINAFALGPWATGLTTYELMRETGDVFATGPDKEKILDQLVDIAKEERRQLEVAVDELKQRNSKISDEDRNLIVTLIENSLKAVLKNRDLSLKDELSRQFMQNEGRAKELMKLHGGRLLAIAERLNRERQQVIIAGYPPFLKDLTDYVLQKGHKMSDFSVIGVVGGQAISEAMRDQLIKHGFNNIYSSYGASDLDINLGVEADDEIFIRKAIEKNPGLARELYGENKGLPMVFHYDPMNYHVEVGEAGELTDELIYTAARTDRHSPRVRYVLGDKGRVYVPSDVQALLAKYGIFHKFKTNLPLMFVWGRDSTVVFNGANLAFTELERAITDEPTLESIVLKKAFYAYHDEQGVEKLEIWLELNDGKAMPDQEHAKEHATYLLSKLSELNQDFRYQLESLDMGTALPVVRFFKRGESPISEAGGHRKQVLIFNEKDLAANYEYPEEGKCLGVTISMSDEILHPKAPTMQ